MKTGKVVRLFRRASTVAECYREFIRAAKRREEARQERIQAEEASEQVQRVLNRRLMQLAAAMRAEGEGDDPFAPFEVCEPERLVALPIEGPFWRQLQAGLRIATQLLLESCPPEVAGARDRLLDACAQASPFAEEIGRTQAAYERAGMEEDAARQALERRRRLSRLEALRRAAAVGWLGSSGMALVSTAVSLLAGDQAPIGGVGVPVHAAASPVLVLAAMALVAGAAWLGLSAARRRG